MSTPPTRPDHFRAAQNLLNWIADDETGQLSIEKRTEIAARAQAHATLALAAATALGARMNNGASAADGAGWAEIAAAPKRGGRS
ncbi:hypothetical protein AB0F91_31795 [Amycolatopsis sp. NPDC023774]|uniref:hypothetical protein n=1 Tax=Amycolatopsis sp. NPDC023774 TaxID=3155015 RepID=UPI00340451DF